MQNYRPPDLSNICAAQFVIILMLIYKLVTLIVKPD